TSCSVPVWIRVASLSPHRASRQPPPIPIHVAELSAWPRVCCVAAGTVQSDAIEPNSVPRSSAPALYPNQLVLWFAFSCACACLAIRSAPVGSNGEALATGAAAPPSSAAAARPRANARLAPLMAVIGFLPAPRYRFLPLVMGESR